jgi:hypothetical protein
MQIDPPIRKSITNTGSPFLYMDTTEQGSGIQIQFQVNNIPTV